MPTRKNKDIAQIVNRVNKSSADFVNRLKNPNRLSIPDWEDSRYIATHKLGVGTDNNGQVFIYPSVQNINGKLVDFTNPKFGKWDGMDSAIERKDTVHVNSIQDGLDFTENYKRYYPKGKTFKFGGRRKAELGIKDNSPLSMAMNKREKAKAIVGKPNTFLDNWNTTRLASGKFDSQLGGGLLETQKANRDSAPVFYSPNAFANIGALRGVAPIRLSSDTEQDVIDRYKSDLETQSGKLFKTVTVAEKGKERLGAYDSDSHTIYVKPNGPNVNATLTEEQAHASKARPQEAKIAEILEKNKENRHPYYDDLEGKEPYARLMKVREANSIDPNKVWDEKSYKEFKKTATDFNFLNRYSDDTVIEIFNTVADAGNLSNDKYEKRLAAYGKSAKVKNLDIREGGIAIPIAPNMYYMNGRSHDEGGIAIGPNNKNGLEVEGGEVVKVGKNDVKVFSSVPLLRGVSPAQLVMGGANPNKVFAAQEDFKDRNRINDDGTTYEMGGNKVIHINNLPSSFKGQLRNGRYVQIGIPPITNKAKSWNNTFKDHVNSLNVEMKNFIMDGIKYGKQILPKPLRKYYARGINILNSPGVEGINNTAQKITQVTSMFDEKKAGGIYIKPSKRGTFTAAATKRGMGVQEFASKVLANKEDYSSAMVKKANFAKNASRWKKEFGGNMIYTINGNVKNGLMSARPKAQYGKQRKIEGYGNTIVASDDTFMLNENGVYVPVGNVQIDKQAKTVRGASGRRDIAYDRQGNRYQRRSDGSLIRVSPEKGNIAVSDTIGEIEVNAPNVTKTRSRKQINVATKTSNTKANPPRQKVEPNFEIGDQTVVNFLKNSNGKYNTQRAPIHSFTPAQKLGLSSYGWSTYNDPNKGYSFREDAAAVRAGQKSVDEIIGQDLSQINFDNNQSNSTPRGREIKVSKSAPVVKPTLQDTVNQITRNAIYKSNTPKIDLSKAKMPTFDVSQLGSKETKSAKAKLNTPPTGSGTQSKDGRWIGQYKTTNVGDWIGLGSNVLGSLLSYGLTKSAINKMPLPSKPVLAQAAKLKTTYNIEPQLSEIREAEQMNRAAVRRNTQSSNTSLAREQRLMNEARGARNTLYGQKENIETQLINQDRLNRQSVMRDNVRAYNEYLNKLTDTKIGQNKLRVSNVNNLISGLTGSVNNILGTIESRRATNNTLRAIAAANPNVDARLIGGFDYYIDPITKKKYNKNQQYVGTING